MTALKAIFYDLDGTLVYFQIDFMAARRSVLSYLTENEVPENILDINLTIRENSSRAINFLRDSLSYNDQQIQKILQGVNDKMVEVEIQAAAKARAVSGVETVLSFCKEKGIKQILCTYNTHRVAELTLKNAQIRDYIDEIYGRDDVVKSKPDIEHLKPAINKYHIAPEEAIMIGDYETDIQLGKAFGCLTIGVITEHSLNAIDNADIKIMQDNFSNELMEIIKNKFV